MSTQFSKRELTAGLGVGALALLAQTQRASADTPFTTFPFAATGAPTPRTMPDRLGEIKNVKDYGAVGDGATDDTAAIQAAFDAAFGPASAPHGVLNVGQNKAVFFPGGKYRVSHPVCLYGVQGGHMYGAGELAANVFNRGGTTGTMTGSISNGTLTITAVTSGAIYRGSIITWPGGPAAVVSDFLTGTGGVGTYVVNSGSTASTTLTIINDTCLYCNGVGYSHFEDIHFGASAKGAIAVELDWDHNSPQGTTCNLFEHCGFEGGAIGCRVGIS